MQRLFTRGRLRSRSADARKIFFYISFMAPILPHLEIRQELVRILARNRLGTDDRMCVVNIVSDKYGV